MYVRACSRIAPGCTDKKSDLESDKLGNVNSFVEIHVAHECCLDIMQAESD